MSKEERRVKIMSEINKIQEENSDLVKSIKVEWEEK